MVHGRPRRGSRLTAIYDDGYSCEAILVTTFKGYDGKKWAIFADYDWFDSYTISAVNKLSDAMGHDTTGELYLIEWDNLFDGPWNEIEEEIQKRKKAAKPKKISQKIGDHKVIVPVSSEAKDT